jgi:hypothetical protein
MDYDPYFIHISLSSLTIWIFTKRSALRWGSGIGWFAGLASRVDIFIAYYLIVSAVGASVLLVIRWVIAKKSYTSIRLIWNEGLKRVLLLLSIVAGFISAFYMSAENSKYSFSLFLTGALFTPLSIYAGVYCAGVVIIHLTRWIAAGFKSSNSNN